MLALARADFAQTERERGKEKARFPKSPKSQSPVDKATKTRQSDSGCQANRICAVPTMRHRRGKTASAVTGVATRGSWRREGRAGMMGKHLACRARLWGEVRGCEGVTRSLSLSFYPSPLCDSVQDKGSRAPAHLGTMCHDGGKGARQAGPRGGARGGKGDTEAKWASDTNCQGPAFFLSLSLSLFHSPQKLRE